MTPTTPTNLPWPRAANTPTPARCTDRSGCQHPATITVHRPDGGLSAAGCDEHGVRIPVEAYTTHAYAVCVKGDPYPGVPRIDPRIKPTPRYAQGSDADDWDTDDGPANDSRYWDEMDADDRNSAQAVQDEQDAEARVLARAAAALAKGVARREQGYPYHVHNPFTGKDTWFATFASALAYASAASAADVLDGDLRAWSAAGWGEYRLYKGGASFSEA